MLQHHWRGTRQPHAARPASHKCRSKLTTGCAITRRHTPQRNANAAESDCDRSSGLQLSSTRQRGQQEGQDAVSRVGIQSPNDESIQTNCWRCGGWWLVGCCHFAEVTARLHSHQSPIATLRPFDSSPLRSTRRDEVGRCVVASWYAVVSPRVRVPM